MAWRQNTLATNASRPTSDSEVGRLVVNRWFGAQRFFKKLVDSLAHCEPGKLRRTRL